MADLADFFKYFDNTAPEKTVDPLQTFDIQIEFNIGMCGNVIKTYNVEGKDGQSVVKQILWLDKQTTTWFDKETQSVNIGMYVQSVSIPNVTSQTNKAQTYLGDIPVQDGIVDMNGELTMEVLNTKKAMHEYLFYPWLRECQSQHWMYNGAPYTTATITIDFTKHNTVKYVFYGCRPTQIDTMDGKQSDDASTIRNITFSYDFMLIIKHPEPEPKPKPVQPKVEKPHSFDRNPTVTRILQSRGDDD